MSVFYIRVWYNDGAKAVVAYKGRNLDEVRSQAEANDLIMFAETTTGNEPIVDRRTQGCNFSR